MRGHFEVQLKSIASFLDTTEKLLATLNLLIQKLNNFIEKQYGWSTLVACIVTGHALYARLNNNFQICKIRIEDIYGRMYSSNIHTYI